MSWRQQLGQAMAILAMSLTIFIPQKAISDAGKPNPLANWSTRFTFEGRDSPGPHGVDPYVWVYTRQFAERFGMPKELIDEGLIGAEAAAWAKIPVDGKTCGWGGKKDVCTYLPEPRLYLFLIAESSYCHGGKTAASLIHQWKERLLI